MTIDPRRTAAFAAGRCGRLLPAALAAALLLGAAPAAAEPVFVPQETIAASPGLLILIRAGDVFDDAGTNPVIASASAANTDRYDLFSVAEGIFHLRAKSSAELRAMEPLPPNPFVTDVTVTMTNGEGESGQGVLTYRTAYAGLTPIPPPPPSYPNVTVKPGATVTIKADWFDNAGTNPRITFVFYEADYYASVSTDANGKTLSVQVKTSEQLRALTPPPPNPFAVEFSLTMENDEGHTATGTVTFETWYDHEADDTGTSPSSSDGESGAPRQ